MQPSHYNCLFPMTGMTESRQNETVERFRNGDYKVLVATSVGSEGIDVPDCNIVLSYNYTGNEITKIQMSGNLLPQYYVFLCKLKLGQIFGHK